jgi:hypothetical protein
VPPSAEATGAPDPVGALQRFDHRESYQTNEGDANHYLQRLAILRGRTTRHRGSCRPCRTISRTPIPRPQFFTFPRDSKNVKIATSSGTGYGTWVPVLGSK